MVCSRHNMKKIYFCFAKVYWNAINITQITIVLNFILLKYIPVKKASIEKSIYTVKLGTSQIEIECIIRTDKTIEDVFWEKEGVQYPIINRPSFDKHYLEREKSVCKLIIKNIIARDNGKYRCIVKYNDGSNDKSNFTELDVDTQRGKCQYWVILTILKKALLLFKFDIYVRQKLSSTKCYCIDFFLFKRNQLFLRKRETFKQQCC